MQSEEKEVLAEAASRGWRAGRWVSKAFIALVAAFDVLTALSYWPGTIFTGHYMLDFLAPRTMGFIAFFWFIGAGLSAVALIWIRFWKIAAPYTGAMMASLVYIYAVQWLDHDVEVAWYSVKNYIFMWGVYLIAVYFASHYVPAEGRDAHAGKHLH